MSAFGHPKRPDAAVPPARTPIPRDFDRLTPKHKGRWAEVQERLALVGMEGLSELEVFDGADIARVLFAPVWPMPETPTGSKGDSGGR